MKAEIEKVIREAAKQAATQVVRQQASAAKVNHYKDTENLLRNYKAMKRIYEHPEEYTFVPPEKSKDISVAPPKGAGVKDRQEMMEEAIESRMRSFGVSAAQYRWLDAVVKQFAERPEFLVIRMMYFSEDADGNELIGGERRTISDIAEELSRKGMERSERTIGRWRSSLVKDMTVCLFVVDGATSIGRYEHGRKEEAGSREEKEGGPDDGHAG